MRVKSFGSSSATTTGSGTAAGTSWGEAAAASTATADVYRVSDAGTEQTGMQTVAGNSQSTSRGGSRAENQFSAQAETTQHGAHQALRALYQTLTTQVHSLEEEVHLAIVRIREQPNQRAIVKLRGQKAKGVIVPEVLPALARAAQITAFRERIKEGSAYLAPRLVVDAEIEQRHAALGIPAVPPEPGDPPPLKDPWG